MKSLRVLFYSDSFSSIVQSLGPGYVTLGKQVEIGTT